MRLKHDHTALHPAKVCQHQGQKCPGAYTMSKMLSLSWLRRASGLFIWAATVCSFLCNFPGSQRLKVLLDTTIPADAMAALTILYQNRTGYHRVRSNPERRKMFQVPTMHSCSIRCPDCSHGQHGRCLCFLSLFCKKERPFSAVHRWTN